MQVNLPRELTLSDTEVAKTELITGENVLQLLSDESFLHSWSCLYQACPWATVFQSQEFVRVWYQVYHPQHLPIVVKEEEGGKLTGLLTLAKDVKELGITAAGGWNAYYHAWLAAEDAGDRFIQKALALVRKRFPGEKITFKYIPPHTPLGWLSKNTYWATRHIIRPFLRPIMDFSAPDIGKLFSKKQFRESRNRLNRLGNLAYEQITDYETFVSLFDELADQYDFRKAVTLNKTPFRKNPQKKAFLLALYRQNILHVAVLRLNGHIIAALVATEGKNRWLHGAGINTHSPEYGRHSPGYVIMMMLGQTLYGQGYQAFDLTPGGHGYKERLANSHDQLYELSITSQWDAFSTKLYYDYVKEKSKALFSGAGISLKQVKISLEKKIKLNKERLKLARQGDLRVLLKQDAGEQHSKSASRLFQLQPSKNYTFETASIPVQLNSLRDLLAFDVHGGPIPRWTFFEDCSERFERGAQAYTLVNNGRLAACVWLLPEDKNSKGSGLILDGIYCHAAEQKTFPAFLAAVAAQVWAGKEKLPLYAKVGATDHAISAALKQAFFVTEVSEEVYPHQA